MNPSLLTSAINKIVNQVVLSSLDWGTNLGKLKSLKLKLEGCCLRNLWHIDTPAFCYPFIQKVWGWFYTSFHLYKQTTLVVSLLSFAHNKHYNYFTPWMFFIPVLTGGFLMEVWKTASLLSSPRFFQVF